MCQARNTICEKTVLMSTTTPVTCFLDHFNTITEKIKGEGQRREEHRREGKIIVEKIVLRVCGSYFPSGLFCCYFVLLFFKFSV